MYKTDDKILAEYYLNNYLFPIPKEKFKRYINKDCLELIVRPECDQQCQYCYIYNHGKDLYPKRLNKEDTLKNINLVLDYVYNQRKNFFYSIELFAGEMFSDGIFFEIMDIFKKYLKQIKIEEPELLVKQTRIMIPSNLNFVNKYPEQIERILNICKEFEKEYNCEISFSWSTDGFYAIDTREKKELNEEYFDNCFKFLDKVAGGIHPMISAANVKYAKQNYDWWLSKYQEFNVIGDFQPMMLEVRNGNEWDEQSIQEYLDFLDYLMEKRFEKCNYSIKELAYHLIEVDSDEEYLKPLQNYDPISLKINHPNDRVEKISCALQGTIHFNCTNLSIVPCHRLTYSVFTAFYFITNEENNKIIDFNTHNLSAFLTLKNHKSNLLPGCCSCKYSDFCLRGCFGAQFEYNANVLMPIPSVCNFSKQKINKIISLYKEYGIIDFLQENNILPEAVEKFLKEENNDK